MAERYKIAQIHFVTSEGVQVTSYSEEDDECLHFLMFANIDNVAGKEIKVGTMYRLSEVPELTDRFKLELI